MRTSPRLLAVLISLFALPLVGSTDFTILLDTDNNPATGCVVAGMTGVEQTVTTTVDLSGSPRVTRLARQQCAGTALGSPTVLDGTGWPAAYDAASGMITVETLAPLSLFGLDPTGNRVGFVATNGSLNASVLDRADGGTIIFPPHVARRRAVTPPVRVITLDGLTADWHGLGPLVAGGAHNGSNHLRFINIYAFYGSDGLYFRFDAQSQDNAPTAEDDAYSTRPGTPLNVPTPGVLANDSDPASRPLTASLVAPAGHGALVLNADGSFSYAPDPGLIGTDTFTYQASNGEQSSNVARVDISVADRPNTRPVAQDDHYSVVTAGTLTIAAPGILANDTDADGDALTPAITATPSHGTLTLNADGSFTYVNDGSGTADSFQYRVSDGIDTSNVATVTIDVTPAAPPQANADSFSVAEGGTLSVAAPGVLANDTPSSGLAATLLTPPLHGTLALQPNGSFIYTHDDSETTSDTFTYQVSNGTLTSQATVTLTVTPVDDPPLSAADTYPAFEDITLTVPAATGLLANDSDVDSPASSLTAAVVTSPTHGTLVLSADGSFTYTPAANFNGTDTFAYRTSDGVLQSGPSLVTINVASVNDAPSFSRGIDLAVLDTDPAQTVAGWASALSAGPADEAGQALTFAVTSDNPALFAAQPAIAATGTLTFAPAAGQTGVAVVTVVLHDDGGTANGGVDTAAPQTFTITVDKIPVITSANATTFTVGTAGSFTTTASARPFATFSESGALPAGVTFTPGGPGSSTGTLAGTPAAGTGGVWNITFTATNVHGSSGPQAFTLTVNEAPAITSGNSMSATVGLPATFTVTTTGFPVPSLSAAGALPAGMTLTDNGNGTATLAGAPAAGTSGIYAITLSASNISGTATQAFTITVACPTIAVANPATASATAGAAFSQQFTSTGGVGALTFSTASALPAGLTLAGDGTLSGTPAQTGTFPIVVTATDVNGCSGSGPTYSLVVTCPTITVTNPAGTSGTAGTPFSQQFVQAGGIGAVAFSTTSTLPAGLTLAADGTLSGTPSQTGTFAIVVTATDANGCSGSGAAYNLVIGCPAITVTNPATTTGTVGTAFSQQFTAVNTIGAVTFTTASTLPAGLTLATDGTLSGTPTAPGAFTITVTATDANGCAATGDPYSLTIACPTITITNPAVASGTAGAPFSQQFTMTGGVGVVTFSTASTLPAGLTLSAAGVLSGTPTQTGTFPIVVTVTDGNGCSGTGATYTLTIGCPAITVTNPATAAGTAGAAFSGQFTESGSIGGATFTTASALPAGLTLSAAGVLSGTPTQTGAFPIVVTVTDGNGCSGTGATYTLTIACPTITVTNPLATTAVAGSAFSQTFTAAGGIGATNFALSSGALPAGLTLAPTGVLSGTPLQTGTFPITVTATDSNGCSGTGATYTLDVVCPTITVTNPANAAGTAGAAFSETFTQSGAVGTATFSTASTLPAGLTLSAAGVLSGTPTETGTFDIEVSATDGNGCSGTGATYTLVIACPTLSVTNPANSSATAGTAFSEQFTQSGGIGTVTFATADALPAGISLSTAGVLSGTPTQTGTFPIVVTVTDANGCSGTGATYTLVVACPTITVTNPATTTGTVGTAFTQLFTQTGAAGGATFSTASTLPAGLTLAADGTLSGTPTQNGTFPIDVTVTDGNGCSGTGATYSLVIGCQLINVTPPATTSAPAGVPFLQSFTQSGALGGATFTTTSTLPAGLTLDPSGALSGTPLQTGTFPIVVTVTDGNGCTGSAPYNLTITCPIITVTNPANTSGTAGQAFSESFAQSGAVGGASFTTTSTLPAGMTLDPSGVLQGVPTQTGTFPIAVTVTDANSCTGTNTTYSLVIGCPTITVTNPANSSGTVNAPLGELFSVTGAVGGYTVSTGSTLPAGVTLAADGTLSGTPTQSGTFPIVVTATDSNGCSGTGTTYNLVIACQLIAVTDPPASSATAGVPFTAQFSAQFTVGATTFSTASTLPNGLTLAADGTLSGTPTQTGSFNLAVTATDANGCSGTSNTYTLTVGCPAITVTNPAITTGTAGVPFSQPFTSTGGIAPVTYTTPATLPNGLTLAADGTLSGIPTQTGLTNIVVTATDANGCSNPGVNYPLVINCQSIVVTPPANAAGTVGTPFSEQFTQSGAIGTATFSTTDPLPSGLSLSGSGLLSGTPSQSGTFAITVTVLDANGCSGTSATYNLVIACQSITVANPAATTATAGTPFSDQFVPTGALNGFTFSTASTLPAGLTLDPSGVLSGTPTQTGTFAIDVTVTDGNGCTGTSSGYTLTVGCQPITLVYPTATTATANTFFSGSFSQISGIGAVTFTTSSTLPAGLTLAADGTLSGTPLQTGDFAIFVTVTDGNGCTSSGTYNLTVNCQTITVSQPSNGMGTAGAPFSETFTQSGAIGSATFSTTSTLPAGLSLAANGVLAGTPLQTGMFVINVTVTDGNGCTATALPYNLLINCQSIAVTAPSNTSATAGSPFSEQFTQSGAIGSATFSTASGLPAGLTLLPTGVLSGTPTQTGLFPIDVTVTDSNGCSGTAGSYMLLVACPVITVTNPVNATATVNSPVNEQFTESGAIGGATFTTADPLPNGLTLDASGLLSGTPTQNGTFPITVLVTDGNSCTGTGGTYNLVVSCQTITVSIPSNAAGVASAPFSESFTQVGAFGGATFSTSSPLPAGLGLDAGGVLSGTPTQTGTFAIDVTVTDGNGCTGTSATYNLTIGCQTITVSNPANAAATAGSPFSESFGESGAIGAATYSTASPLPAGLTLSSAGVLSGTPLVVGLFTIQVTVTDSNGCTGTGVAYNLTIGCQTITVTPPANTSGTAASPFSETFTQSGAIGGATFATASPLPNGLSLAANGTLSGTPLVTGTFSIDVTVTDGNGCTGAAATYSLLIDCQTISVTAPANTAGIAGTPFSEQFTQSGAIGTATFGTASPLPAGLTLDSAGLLSGTPTQTGTFPIVVMVTDSNGCSGTLAAAYNLVIACPTITITNPTNTSGTVNSAINEQFTQSGGIAPAVFSTTDPLPAGVNLDSDGLLSGTPTQSGTFAITVLVTDANGCTGTSATYTLVIGCQTYTVTNPANSDGTAGTAFSEQFTQSGGVGAISWSLASGGLPSAITLNPATGVLSGTTHQAGLFTITVMATDANGCTSTGAPYGLNIGCQTINVTPPSNNTGVVDAPFSETFNVTGILDTVTWSESGALPAGITLDPNSGVLSGTPTVPGTFPITVTATDTNGCFMAVAYTLTINCQTITVTNPAATTGTVDAPYSDTFGEAGAHGGAAFSTTSTLPPGLSLNSSTGALSGIPTAPGTYPIDVTVTDANGCTGTNTTFNLVINCQLITVNNPTNANGTVNAGFSEQFTQSNAHGSATFSTASTLPAGLSLDGAGLLSGTPTEPFNADIVVTVTDANLCTGSTTYHLTINCQTISVTNPVNTTGTTGVAFSEQFTQSGGGGTTTFSLDVTSDPLPAGLTLDANSGILSGIPTVSGTFNLVVKATDANGCSGIGAVYALVLSCPAITVSGSPAIHDAQVGVAYSPTITFSQTGGYTTGATGFTVGSGALPAGMTLHADTGVLDGTPTAAGSFTFSVTYTDGYGCTGNSGNLTFAVCPSITVTNPVPTTAKVGVLLSASYQFTQSGAASPTFSVASGYSLPSGIALSSAGLLTGTPDTPGTYTFRVTVTDGAGCTGTGGDYTLTVQPSAQNQTFSGQIGNTLSYATGGTAATTFPALPITGSLLTGALPATGTAVVAASGATTNGGSYTVYADGTFLFTPKAGTYTNDSFTFQVVNNGVNSTSATVTLQFGTNHVWYVKNNAASGGTGVSSLPFDTLASAATASAAGDIIYVLAGDGTSAKQNAGITLKNTQTLIGEGTGLDTILTSLVNAGPGANPVISNTAGSAVTLANGNTVTGFTISTATTAYGILGNAIAGATIGDSTISGNGAGIGLANVTGTVTVAADVTVSNNAGQQVYVNGGNGIINVAAALVANSGERSVEVTARTGGTVTFSGAITDSGTGINVSSNTSGTITFSGSITATGAGISVSSNSGAAVTFSGTQTLHTATAVAVSLSSNTGSTITFSGNLDILTTSGAGFSATGGGTLHVAATTATISTGAGTALSLNGMTLGSGSGAGVTFDSVSANGATTGISLTTLTGAVTINGGTLQGITNTAVSGLTFGTLTLTNVAVGIPAAKTAIGLNLSGGTFGGTGSSIDASNTAMALDTVTLAGGTTMTSVSSSGGANGISFNVVSGNGLTVNGGALSGNTAAGFTSAGGTATFSYAGSISNNAARLVDVSNAAATTCGTFTFSGNLSANAGTGIRVNNCNSGTIVFSGAAKSISTGANPAVTLTNNTGATVNFTAGGLALTTTTATAFSATGGGTVTVTGLGNSITTTTGTALNIVSTTVGGSGVTFDSASTNGAATAVNLDTVGSGAVAINGGTIVNASTRGLDVNGGTGNVTLAASITTSGTAAATHSVEVTSHTGGTVTVSGAVTDNAGGINLVGNTGGTITFSGGLALTTGANPAFTATGGGTVNATQNNSTIVNTITTTTGTALNVANTTIGTSNLTFRSISAGTAASGPTNAIILSNTGSSGGLLVVGNGGSCTSSTPTCTGGTIQRAGSLGNYAVSLTGTSNAEFNRLQIKNTGDRAINGTNVAGFTLRDSFIFNWDNGTHGSGATVDAMNFTGLTGTVTIQRDEIGPDGAFVLSTNPPLPENKGIVIRNSSVTNLTMTVTGTKFTQISNDGIDAEVYNGTATLSVDGSTADGANTFNQINGRGVTFSGPTDNPSAKTLDLTIKNNTFTTVAIGGRWFAAGLVTMNARYNSNAMTGTSNDAIRSIADATNPSLQAAVNATVNGNSMGGGSTFIQNHRKAIQNITFSNNNGIALGGIWVGSGEGSTVNADILNNTVAVNGSTGANALYLQAAPNGAGLTTICANISGNNLSEGANGGPSGPSYALLLDSVADANAHLNLQGWNGSSPAYDAFLAGQNTISAPGVAPGVIADDPTHVHAAVDCVTSATP